MQLDNKIKQLGKSCFYHCKKVNTILFDNDNEIGAICCLNLAIGDMSVLKSICYSNWSSVGNDDLENLFEQFDIFAREITNNFVTNHSHQWTSIEYEKLQDLFISLFNIETNS